MKVFRMQDSSNDGPFTLELSSCATIESISCYHVWLGDYVNIYSLHPGPGDDGLRQYLHSNKGALFGCPSLYMICRWFHPLFPVLTELGLEVVEYDASEAWIGRSKSQVIFHYDKAIRVRTVPLCELLTHKERYERSIE